MRFRDFLAEVFNTKATGVVFKRISHNRVQLRFLEGDKLFGVQFDTIPREVLDTVEPVLDVLKDQVILSVSFGDVNANDDLNFKGTNYRSVSSIHVISKVYNLIADAVKETNASVVIFSAKKQDDLYKSRVSLYDVIVSSVEKYTNFAHVSSEDAKGTYYALYDRDLDLSLPQRMELKNQMKDKPNTLLSKILNVVSK